MYDMYDIYCRAVSKHRSLWTSGHFLSFHSYARPRTIKCAYRRACRFLDNDNYRDCQKLCWCGFGRIIKARISMSSTKSPKYQGKIRICIIQVYLKYCFGEIFSIVPGISHPPLIGLISCAMEGMDDSTWRCKSKNLAVMTSADPSLVRLHDFDNDVVFFWCFFCCWIDCQDSWFYWKLNRCW